MTRPLGFASPHPLLGLQKNLSEFCKDLYIWGHFLYWVTVCLIPLMPHVGVRSHHPVSSFELGV